MGKSNATDSPVCPFSSSLLNRELVSLGDEKPAYCLIVHSLSAYIPGWMPLLYGGSPEDPGLEA